jgi:carboxymethylenebutenolidase
MMRSVLAAAFALGRGPVVRAGPVRRSARRPHDDGAAARRPRPRRCPTIPAIPPANAASAERLKNSPRHGEWVDIKMPSGPALKSFVVYPERKDKAPVVLVIHDIGGMGDWGRAVGDQLAKEGFIAIVPDLLSGKGPNGGGTEELGQGVGQAIPHADPRRRGGPPQRRDGVRQVAALVEQEDRRDRILLGRQREHQLRDRAARAQCLGDLLRHAADERRRRRAGGRSRAAREDQGAGHRVLRRQRRARHVNVEPTAAEMKRLGKSFESHVMEGAGHGFLKGQASSEANAKAAVDAWPLTIAFLKKHTQ